MLSTQNNPRNNCINQAVSYPMTQSLSGELELPGDKSMTHRALILASIAEGQSVLHHCLLGDDNLALLHALQRLGVQINRNSNGGVIVEGRGLNGLSSPKNNAVLDLGNSGTAMRLLMGVLAAQPFSSELTGDDSLRRRPMARVAFPLRQMGASIALSPDNTAPIFVTGLKEGALNPIDYVLPVPSAQVKSAILLAGLWADGLTTVREPVPTRDHTERLLTHFGCPVRVNTGVIQLKGRGRLQGVDLHIPGDLSSAAFFMVAASLVPGSEINLKRVGVNPTRTGCLSILKRMGATIALNSIQDTIREQDAGPEPLSDICIKSAKLHGVEVSPRELALAIDEIPCLAVAAAQASGRTVFRGIGELRVKECDRASAIVNALTSLGIQAAILGDDLWIEGGQLQGGVVNSDGDHRIAMAMLIAGAVAAAPITVRDCEMINTSFPDFIVLANQLGLKIKNY
jgi:3-phosphoshikimate 1-carboxyvinyltransferase